MTLNKAINSELATNSSVKILNGTIVNGGHDDFSSLQDAVNFCIENSYTHLHVPQGSYGPIRVPSGNLHISGASRRDSEVDKITIETGNCTVENIAIFPSGSKGLVFTDTARLTLVRNCQFDGGSGLDSYVEIDCPEVIVTDCFFDSSDVSGNTIDLLSNSSQCIVSNNSTSTSSTTIDVNDAGTGNLVTDNL